MTTQILYPSKSVTIQAGIHRLTDNQTSSGHGIIQLHGINPGYLNLDLEVTPDGLIVFNVGSSLLKAVIAGTNSTSYLTDEHLFIATSQSLEVEAWFNLLDATRKQGKLNFRSLNNSAEIHFSL